MGRLLDISQVTAGYGSITVLRNISIGVDAGECIGLFGPNGHGKTTLLQTISGLLRAGFKSYSNVTIPCETPRHEPDACYECPCG